MVSLSDYLPSPVTWQEFLEYLETLTGKEARNRWLEQQQEEKQAWLHYQRTGDTGYYEYRELMAQRYAQQWQEVRQMFFSAGTLYHRLAFVWRGEGDACKTCQERSGKVFTVEQLQKMFIHPNCKCILELKGQPEIYIGAYEFSQVDWERFRQSINAMDVLHFVLDMAGMKSFWVSFGADSINSVLYAIKDEMENAAISFFSMMVAATMIYYQTKQRSTGLLPPPSIPGRVLFRRPKPHVPTAQSGRVGRGVRNLSQNADNLARRAEGALSGGAVTARRLNYRPSSGAQVVATPGRTTTLIGSYTQDVQYVIEELNIRPSTYTGAVDGGFNVLNVPQELANAAGDQFWKKYNEPWLRAAIERGDIIYVLTEPVDGVLRYADGRLRGFGQEIAYLLDRGYVMDWSTYTMMKP